ncbi:MULTISPECIES: phage tail protein [Serratia]|uniref:hypothetical protein n=1 Tax=Serratia TaxID=613 RepID=UPI000744FAFF|nr:hypothetical protein [Serratia marcescens]EME1465814.1 hypothetical protein [Serratia marcescens]MDP8622152.1 hypothetical protein [Serratia marcescens]CUZ00522.1 Uncharacterised protein [Serratia marcescens]CUZ13887.1 Uncharacterised protein [Serratia marcescens]CVB77053.1 Uncharacterised protein [Serratia marcescens]
MGGGGKGSKKVTVGYRYSWDIQAGIGRGPVNEIVAISADKKTVFAGTPGQITGNTSLYIDKPNLFGGEDTGGEGGIQGTLEVMMGGPDQVPSPSLLTLLTGLVPGFRGLVTTFFSGLVSCYSASPKPWSYRVRRSTQGWDGPVWYPEKALILLQNTEGQLDDEADLTAEQIANLRAIHAMNPAHILVECALNRDWGRGLVLGDLDIDSYRIAADRLYDEGFGLCFRYNRQDDLNTFVQQVLDHIGAAQYGDLSTGKLTLKLLRDDYDPNTLPLFTYDNGIVGVQDDDSTSADAAPNEIVVTYRDPVTNSEGEVRAQNLGAIQNVGLISESVEYKAVPTHALGARLAQRDLETRAAGLTRLIINFDRRGGVLTPAGVFRISLPERNIGNMVMRVGKIEEQDTGELKVTAIQDVFGMPSTSYSSGEQGSTWSPPDKTARPVTDSQLLELPYIVLAATVGPAELAAIPLEAGYLGVMASAPSSAAINYLLQTRADGVNWRGNLNGDWTPAVTLTQPAGRFDTTFKASLTTLPAVGAGAIIGDEIVRIDAADLATGTLTVGRGCADTLPADHLTGARLRFFQDAIESDGLEYLEGETIDVRLLTRTAQETLAAGAAPINHLTLQARQAKPYLPANIRLNDEPYPLVAEPAAEYILTWSHRDRQLQADRLIDYLDSSIGPESGVVYVITLVRPDTGDIVWTTNTVEATLTLPYSSATSPLNRVHTVSIEARRGDIASLSNWVITLPTGHYVEPTPEPEPPPEEPTA